MSDDLGFPTEVHDGYRLIDVYPVRAVCDRCGVPRTIVDGAVYGKVTTPGRQSILPAWSVRDEQCVWCGSRGFVPLELYRDLPDVAAALHAMSADATADEVLTAVAKRNSWLAEILAYVRDHRAGLSVELALTVIGAVIALSLQNVTQPDGFTEEQGEQLLRHLERQEQRDAPATDSRRPTRSAAPENAERPGQP